MTRRNGKPAEERNPLELGKQAVPEDATSLAKWPMLCNLLWPRHRDGKCVREAGRIVLKVVGGYYVVSVACPTEQVQTQLVFETLDGLLDQLEIRVHESTCVWLPDFESQKRARQQARK
jgi:hypothetical protein